MSGGAPRLGLPRSPEPSETLGRVAGTDYIRAALQNRPGTAADGTFDVADDRPRSRAASIANQRKFAAFGLDSD